MPFPWSISRLNECTKERLCSSVVFIHVLIFVLSVLQACRGARLDRPVKIIHETDSTNSYSIPAYADIMVAYSTYDGTYRCVFTFCPHPSVWTHCVHASGPPGCLNKLLILRGRTTVFELSTCSTGKRVKRIDRVCSLPRNSSLDSLFLERWGYAGGSVDRRVLGDLFTIV